MATTSNLNTEVSENKTESMSLTQFHHSVKLPQVYKKASKALKEIAQMKSNFKAALQAKLPRNRLNAIYALVTKTMKYNSIIEQMIDATPLRDETRLDRDLAKVLIIDIIFNKKTMLGQAKPIQKIIENRIALEDAMKRILKNKYHAGSLDEINVGANFPVYVRINNLKTNADDFVKYLEDYEYVEIKYNSEITYDGFLELITSLEEGYFLRDFHVDSLFIFSSGTSFFDCDMYRNGQVVIQDKASCFPPLLLNPRPGSTVIDACAAPGMKTSFLAAMMENSGHLLAVERNESRMKSLEETLNKTGVECATKFLNDFTNIDPMKSPFCDAKYILIDPSCSGSGMKNRVLEGSLSGTDTSKERLEGLAYFQVQLLSHALKFPKVKRIVYSTCSTTIEENENVISEVMEKFGDEFELINAMPQWPRRGLGEQYNGAMRTDSKIDLMNGFFVAVIKRKKKRKSEKRKYSEEDTNKERKKKKRKEKFDNCN